MRTTVHPMKSAAWMQCELYHQARVAGLGACVEVSIQSIEHRSGSFRVDVLLMKDGKAVLACECKGEGSAAHWEHRNTRQERAYANCGVASMLVKSEEGIRHAIMRASKL